MIHWLLLLMLFSVVPVHAATYYVSFTDGDNTRTTTQAQNQATPWKTNTGTGGVNSRTFVAGDQILFKRGDTWLSDPLIPPSSGSAGSPIVFGAYGSGAVPKFDGNNIAHIGLIRINGNRSYLTFEDFELTNSQKELVNIIATDGGVNNVILQRLNVHTQGNPLEVGVRGCISVTNARQLAAPPWIAWDVAEGAINNITIKDSTISECKWNAITINDGTHDVTIENNQMFDFDHHGVDVVRSGVDGFVTRDAIIRNNIIYDGGWAGGATGCVFVESANTVLIDGNSCFLNANGTSTGIKVQTGDCCTLVDNDIPTNITIQRNVIQNSNLGANAFFISGTSNTILYNNTGYGWAGGVTFLSGNTNLSQQNNLYYNNTSGNTPGFDGRFADAASRDFRLCTDVNQPVAGCPGASNAINAGVDVGLPYNGAAPDLGALETSEVNTIPKPPDNLVPTVQSSFSILLTWIAPTQNTDGSTLTNLTGYRILWCSNAPTCIPSSSIDIGLGTSYLHTGLAGDTLFRYQIAAKNVAGLFSWYTNIVSATTPIVPVAQPVAYWPMNETSGTQIVDIFGGHNGTLCEGATCPHPAPSTMRISGDMLGAILCDGVNDNIEIPTTPALRIAGDLTIAFRMKLRSTSNLSNGAVVFHTEDCADPFYTTYFIDLVNPTTPRFRYYHYSGSFDLFEFNNYTIPINPTDRSHYTLVRNATTQTIKLYVNGTSVQTVSYSSVPGINTAPLMFCTSCTKSSPRYPNIELDEVRIYSQVLSDSAIARLAQPALFFGLECSIGVGNTYTRLTNCPSAFPICVDTDSAVAMGSIRSQALPLNPGASGVSGINVTSQVDDTFGVALEDNEQTDIAYSLRFQQEISINSVKCRPVHHDGTPVNHVLSEPPAQVFGGEFRLFGPITGGTFR